MIHPNRREAQKAATHEAILEAGLELVAQLGLDGLTVAKVAREVGVTPGALYKHFANKGALIAALNRRVVEHLAADVEHTIALHSEPMPRLVAVIGLYPKLARERPAWFSMIQMTMADPRNLVPDLKDAVHIGPLLLLLHRVAGLLDDAAAAGVLNPGPGHERALQLVFGMAGVLQLAKLTRFDAVTFDPQALARTTASDLLVSWGAGRWEIP